MSGMKRFAEEVMTEMGKEEIDEEVLAEAQRRLDASPSLRELHSTWGEATDGERSGQFWISYTVHVGGGATFHKIYDVGHSMKCKWTSFIHDLENHGTPGHWRIVEESETRKVVAYKDQIVTMTVFQLVTLSVLSAVPEVEVTDQVSVGQCIESGQHLTDCDDDGYCNFCGEQEG